jgi:trans-2,3-dihydro-3-hydroxyanthranilate isomerase
MRSYKFIQVDVFTRTRLEGNPLAVFTDAQGLSDSEMQALAREMNLAETTFILPRDAATEEREGVKVRIFTVEEELSFAGHPTLGTSWVVRQQNGGNAQSVTLDLRVGKIPVTFENVPDGVFGEMRQRDPEFGVVHAIADLARATGLDLKDIRGDVPAQTVSTGLPFAIVPLRELATLQRIHERFQFAQAQPYLKRTGADFFYFLWADPSGRGARSRMIFYHGEDPATGSAAGCATSWMVRYGVIPPDTRALIEQGREIKRPSQIYVRASREGDRVTNVRVGGHVVEVLRGEVTL